MKSFNPFSVPTRETRQIRVHKDMVQALKNEQNRQQKICDGKYGKNRKKVSLAFASKVLGGMLK
jgi:hypothetical protein